MVDSQRFRKSSGMDPKKALQNIIPDTCSWLSKSPNVWLLGRFSKPENSQKNPGYLPSNLNYVVRGNTYGRE